MLMLNGAHTQKTPKGGVLKKNNRCDFHRGKLMFSDLVLHC